MKLISYVEVTMAKIAFVLMVPDVTPIIKYTV